MDQPDRTQDAPFGCPRRIDVVGGGLWSRVIVETLCGLTPPSTAIGIHSAHNYELLSEWRERQGLAGRVQVTQGWKESPGSQTGALIIANAARDHGSTLEKVLPSRIPVLVEKPFTTTGEETRRLMALSEQFHVPVAASHVFLFARYLENFVAMLAREEAIKGLSIRWTDPHAELRHGGKKSFDPGVPLHIDVLPHVSSLIGALLPGHRQSCRSLEVSSGGAQLQMKLDAGGIPCSVDLGRNAVRRERVIKAVTGSRSITLDFTGEPRVLWDDGQVLNGDPDWGIKPGPLATMLKAFLISAGSGLADPRLSVEKALQGNDLADEITPLYHQAVTHWLSTTAPQPGAGEEAGVRYALREHFHAGGHAVAAETDRRMDDALRTLRGATPDDVIDFIQKTRYAPSSPDISSL